MIRKVNVRNPKNSLTFMLFLSRFNFVVPEVFFSYAAKAEKVPKTKLLCLLVLDWSDGVGLR